MGVTDKEKELCAKRLISMIIDTLHNISPELTRDSLLEEFINSKTYSKLFDFETKLWTEGPDYILCLYAEEKEIELNIFDD